MNRSLFWVLTLLGACALSLVITNIVLFTGNRALQQEVSARQKYINDSIRLNQLNNQLIELVAKTAASTGDTQLRNLLEVNGVTFQVSQQPVEAEHTTGGVVAGQNGDE